MSRFGTIYERIRPLIVWLGLGELAWIGSWVLNSGDTTPGYVATAVVWLILMLGWMALVIYLGNLGVFLKHTRWLSNLGGFALVLALPAVLFGAIGVAREGLVLAASHTSNLQLASFHMLRLLAIGTVIKYMQGQLPLHFVIFGSVPDILFAASAVIVTILQATTPLGQDFLIVWHIVGFFVFFGRYFHVLLSTLTISHLPRRAGLIPRLPVSDASGSQLHRPIVRSRTRLCAG